ncbi:MAG: hypothetical protein ACREIQ_01985, partial [Nitrospiria bacterium]
MKPISKRREITVVPVLLALGIAGVLIFRFISGRAAAAEQPPTPDSPHHLTAMNFNSIARSFWDFVNVERRFPSSSGELESFKDGLYMVVSTADLTNPYTHQPVEWVTEPSPGNFTWLSNGDGSITLRNYYTNEQGVIQTWDSPCS